MDNTEMRTVHNHCIFLEENKTYQLMERINPESGIWTSFYKKLKDEGRWPSGTRCRAEHEQLYNHRRIRERSLAQILRSMLGR